MESAGLSARSIILRTTLDYEDDIGINCQYSEVFTGVELVHAALVNLGRPYDNRYRCLLRGFKKEECRWINATEYLVGQNVESRMMIVVMPPPDGDHPEIPQYTHGDDDLYQPMSDDFVKQVMNPFVGRDKFTRVDCTAFSTNLKAYQKQERIGKGTFGVVYKGIFEKTGEIVAIKTMLRRDEISWDEYNKMFNCEVQILARTRHPALLSLHGYCPASKNGSQNALIVTPFMRNGSLRDQVDSESRGLCRDEWDAVCKHISLLGIANGMAFLHALTLMHRDLKPENVFLDDNWHPVIGDFGISRKVMNPATMTEGKGTPLYMAPETHEAIESIEAVDVYAFGMLMYVVLTATIPDDFTDPRVLGFQVYRGWRPKIPECVNAQYRQLIKECWDQVPSRRPKFREIYNRLTNIHLFDDDEIAVERITDYQESLPDVASFPVFDDDKANNGEGSESKKSSTNSKHRSPSHRSCNCCTCSCPTCNCPTCSCPNCDCCSCSRPDCDCCSCSRPDCDCRTCSCPNCDCCSCSRPNCDCCTCSCPDCDCCSCSRPNCDCCTCSCPDCDCSGVRRVCVALCSSTLFWAGCFPFALLLFFAIFFPLILKTGYSDLLIDRYRYDHNTNVLIIIWIVILYLSYIVANVLLFWKGYRKMTKWVFLYIWNFLFLVTEVMSCLLRKYEVAVLVLSILQLIASFVLLFFSLNNRTFIPLMLGHYILTWRLVWCVKIDAFQDALAITLTGVLFVFMYEIAYRISIIGRAIFLISISILTLINLACNLCFTGSIACAVVQIAFLIFTGIHNPDDRGDIRDGEEIFQYIVLTCLGHGISISVVGALMKVTSAYNSFGSYTSLNESLISHKNWERYGLTVVSGIGSLAMVLSPGWRLINEDLEALGFLTFFCGVPIFVVGLWFTVIWTDPWGQRAIFWLLVQALCNLVFELGGDLFMCIREIEVETFWPFHAIYVACMVICVPCAICVNADVVNVAAVVFSALFAWGGCLSRHFYTAIVLEFRQDELVYLILAMVGGFLPIVWWSLYFVGFWVVAIPLLIWIIALLVYLCKEKECCSRY